jgi:hypothetical protein
VTYCDDGVGLVDNNNALATMASALKIVHMAFRIQGIDTLMLLDFGTALRVMIAILLYDW